MFDYPEALEKVLTSVPAPCAVELGIAGAFELVLAQDVRADADMPAFDRTAMDGYAVRSEDTKTAGAVLLNIGEASAGGEMLNRPVGPGECAAIYTGAAIPAGADAVVMVEKTRAEGERVHIQSIVKKGENIRFRGEDVRQGELLLKSGAILRPQEIAVCASFGAPRVLAYPRPRICILSTGDELVAPHESPPLGCIRDSNGIMLAAQSSRAGAVVVRQTVVRDIPENIESEIRAASDACDILILSGGVSMGARDHVAPILAKLGFSGGFHKSRIKPGKPVWFGRKGSVLAFGLPGNPVSSFVTFELFTRPAICKLLGREPGPPFRRGVVSGGPGAPADREQFVPARVENNKITFLSWTSSADFVELARANALARIPIGVVPLPGVELDWLEI